MVCRGKVVLGLFASADASCYPTERFIRIAPDGICEQSFRFRPTRGLEGFHPGVMKPRIAPRADCNSCHSLPVGLFKGFGVEEGSAEISLSQISSIKTATCEVRSA